MKKYLLAAAILICGAITVFAFQEPLIWKGKTSSNTQPVLKDGDIIFQSSISPQCQAIKQATHSPYSHCGIVYKEGNKFYVYEAIEPISKTPLKEWIARSDNNEYAVRRLKNADAVLTAHVIAKMKKAGERFSDKHYDAYFGWSDDLIYCSELVWKIYKEGAGLEIGHLKKLREFDLSSPLVKQTMQQRYGNIPPLDELAISPGDLYNSDLLMTVH